MTISASVDPSQNNPVADSVVERPLSESAAGEGNHTREDKESSFFFKLSLETLYKSTFV